MNDSNSDPNHLSPGDTPSRFVDAALNELARNHDSAAGNDAFLDRLDQHLDEEDQRSHSHSDSKPGTARKGRAWLWVGGGIAAASLVVLAAVQMFPPREDDPILLAGDPVPNVKSSILPDGKDDRGMLSIGHGSGSRVPAEEPIVAEPSQDYFAETPGRVTAEDHPVTNPEPAMPVVAVAPVARPKPSQPAPPAPSVPRSQPVPQTVEETRKYSDGFGTEAEAGTSGLATGLSAGNSLASGGMRGPSPAPDPVMTGRDAVLGDAVGRADFDEKQRSFSRREADAPHPIAPGKPVLPTRPPSASGERYGELIDNRFLSPIDAPLSTFSVDVDTASYTNLRRMIGSGSAVPQDAVRIEEMINYFSYDYPQPVGEHPFALALETAACPWNGQHQLLRVGIQGKDMDRDRRPDANLVFLLDVSGSMNSDDKLPLVKQSMSMLVEELTERDCVSIVVYAGAEGLALLPTKGSEHATILRSLDRLKSGGSTNGGAGIQLAYQVAAENFIEEGINRVILCTDGDFNVGKTEDGDLVRMVERKAKTGVFLSVLGIGTGNINDSMMESITNQGNGTYYYIDSLREARKVFLQDIMSTLVTIAKDVKIQIEFNPAQVQSYRLIGYANRMLKAEDFENDKIDAGEVGAGHAVTALYEIVPSGVELKAGDVANPHSQPALKYQREESRRPLEIVDNGELATVKLRYKLPDSDTSVPMAQSVMASSRKWKKASNDFQFSAAVALFGMELRGGKFAGEGTLDGVIEMAREGMGADPFGRREEFIGMVKAIQGAERH